MPLPRSPRRWVSALLGLGIALCGVTSARGLGGLRAPAPGEGHPVSWRGWEFRWSIRPREGLVLSDVRFQNRTVLKHAALCEIFVPYAPGQPRPEDSLDGMGLNVAELIPGQDCLPGTTCNMLNADGKPEGKRYVGLHEESAGLVYLGEKGRAYGKMLVIWCASRLGGYTYFIRWKFRDDGALMPDVGLTGKLEHTREGTASPYGTVVARNGGKELFAPAHVHNFYYRLDFDIDGAANDVVEEFNYKQEEPNRSLAFRNSWTPLPKETTRSLDSGAFRSWRVVDKLSVNTLGHRRSYELMPGGNGVFRGAASEPVAQADLWINRYRRSEFPLTLGEPRPVKGAMAGWVNGESVDGADVVLWYSMHVHHLPRTEDYPAMPVVWEGFTLMPRDFLDESPLKPE